MESSTFCVMFTYSELMMAVSVKLSPSPITKIIMVAM